MMMMIFDKEAYHIILFLSLPNYMPFNLQRW